MKHKRTLYNLNNKDSKPRPNRISICMRGVFVVEKRCLTSEGWMQAQLQEATAMADLFKIEIHGPQAELDQLYEPLKDINPTYFVQH
jgi:hypothetical protein